MDRDWGWKLGIPLTLIGFFIVAQTTLAPFLPQISIAKYVKGFKFPTLLFGINTVIAGWIIFGVGLFCTITAIFDLPPFNW